MVPIVIAFLTEKLNNDNMLNKSLTFYKSYSKAKYNVVLHQMTE